MSTGASVEALVRKRYRKIALFLIFKNSLTPSDPYISVLLALCEENSPVTGGFPSQRASYAKFAAALKWKGYWTNSQVAGGLRGHDIHAMLLKQVQRFGAPKVSVTLDKLNVRLGDENRCVKKRMLLCDDYTILFWYFCRHTFPDNKMISRVFPYKYIKTRRLWCCREKGILVPVMAWCRQATCHYLKQFQQAQFRMIMEPEDNELSTIQAQILDTKTRQIFFSLPNAV